jgi:hypothetical protein
MREPSTEDIVGKATMNKVTNKAGRILIDFCRDQKMVLKSTFSNNKNKITWKGDKEGVNGTLDYTAVQKKSQQGITRCRVEHRCVGYSDHRPVIGIMKLQGRIRRTYKKPVAMWDRQWLNERMKTAENTKPN